MVTPTPRFTNKNGPIEPSGPDEWEIQ